MLKAVARQVEHHEFLVFLQIYEVDYYLRLGVALSKTFHQARYTSIHTSSFAASAGVPLLICRVYFDLSYVF